MPSYQGQVKDRDLDALIWFIKSLREGEEVPETWTAVGGIPGEEPEEGEETDQEETDQQEPEEIAAPEA